MSEPSPELIDCPQCEKALPLDREALKADRTVHCPHCGTAIILQGYVALLDAVKTILERGVAT